MVLPTQSRQGCAAHHRRGVRHDDQPLSVLLAELAGSGGDRDHPQRRPLKRRAASRRRQYRRMRFDTLFGMAFSNLIALAIMLATAATLHAQGVTHIDTAAEAAEALRADRRALRLRPVRGRDHRHRLARRPGARRLGRLRGRRNVRLEGGPRVSSRARRRRFYWIIVVATFIGVALDWSTIDPIRALFWSAVLNGVAAVPHHGRDDARRVEPQHHGTSA